MGKLIRGVFRLLIGMLKTLVALMIILTIAVIFFDPNPAQKEALKPEEKPAQKTIQQDDNEIEQKTTANEESGQSVDSDQETRAEMIASVLTKLNFLEANHYKHLSHEERRLLHEYAGHQMNNNKQCFRIIDGDKSVSNTHYWFDCEEKTKKIYRIKFSLEDMKTGALKSWAPVTTKSNAIKICKELIQQNIDMKVSYDIVDMAVYTHENGRIRVTLGFKVSDLAQGVRRYRANCLIISSTKGEMQFIDRVAK